MLAMFPAANARILNSEMRNSGSANSTPYHLAHGLLDHAAHLAARGDTEAATAAISEAVGIAARLGCQPLGDRAERTQPARPRTAAS